VSADGRFIAFSSFSTNLVIGDTNATYDVFLRDTVTSTTVRINISSAGVQANGVSGAHGISMSPDGRYVAYDSSANNLVPGDSNGSTDIFVFDRQLSRTERVSVASNGTQSNGLSWYPSISADGRYVAFTSSATNLVPGDGNGVFDAFVRDRISGTTERVSVSSAGVEGDNDSYAPSISADGRYVSFSSLAGNLAPGDTNACWDVFVRDRLSGTTERVSVSSMGAQGNGNSYEQTISSDCRYVSFTSNASDLVPGDTNAADDAFVHDRTTGMTERVGLDSGGIQGDRGSGGTTISDDGRYVAFSSDSTNLVAGDTNQLGDVFVRDRLSNTTERASLSTAGVQGNGVSFPASISGNGRFVVFGSEANNLVPADTNGYGDIFVHDRAASGFTSLCDPGFGGVMVCPCSNPPGASGRGCDNSAATGGGILSASGIAYLSIDSLVFTTSGERPTAFSIVMQGNTLLPNGVVYGQGVRCVGGTTKRLFTKTAVGGSITAPDFTAGDPTVSARSAAKGDVIQPGQSRWYLVYYRDPIVLGGCPASSTFNATQTGQVSWWP
jgi:Tol biopolymer transport system component